MSQSSATPPKKTFKTWVKAFLLGALSLVVLRVGGDFVIQKVRQVPGICKVINNCASDEQFQNTYNKATKAIDRAIASKDPSQAVSLLDKAMSDLQIIPQSANIYKQAQEELQEAVMLKEKLQGNLSPGEDDGMVSDILTQNVYDKAKEKLLMADDLADSAKSLADLRTAIADLDEALSELQQISQSANVYNQVPDTLESGEALRSDLRSRVLKEERANSLLEQAKQDGKEAQEVMQNSTKKTDENYLFAYRKWKGAIAGLEKIPNSSFVYPESSRLVESYQEEIRNLPPDCDTALFGYCLDYEQ
jgi:hypothetical protein